MAAGHCGGARGAEATPPVAAAALRCCGGPWRSRWDRFTRLRRKWCRTDGPPSPLPPPPPRAACQTTPIPPEEAAALLLKRPLRVRLITGMSRAHDCDATRTGRAQPRGVNVAIRSTGTGCN